MIYLSIETCFKTASISLFKEGKVYNKSDLKTSNQSESLSKMVAELLLETETKINQVSSVIANKGPGSFTGVRIGLSFMEGLCFGNNIKKLYVSSFGSILGNSINRKFDKNVLVVLNAIRDTFYIQQFSPNLEEVAKPLFLSFEELNKFLQNEEFLLIGNFKGYQFNCSKNDIINNLEVNSLGVLNAFLRFSNLVSDKSEPLYIRGAVNN